MPLSMTDMKKLLSPALIFSVILVTASVAAAQSTGAFDGPLKS